MSKPRARYVWIGPALQATLVFSYCAWVLSMPVFPSQDGPLHLYCIEVFRQLLTHHPGAYAQTYFINRYLPPYSLYYYGVIALGSGMTLAMADKVIVCIYFVILPLGIRSLVRAVAGTANWTPLLFMPVLLSWPLMMGFVNFCIAVGFACFALALWSRNLHTPSHRTRVQFLGWLALILLTHPVPWLFVLAFCFLELSMRWITLRRDGSRSSVADKLAADKLTAGKLTAGKLMFRADLATALAGCLGYFYLRHFSTPLPPNDPIVPVPLFKAIGQNAFDYLRTRGLSIYSGTHGAALLYRLGIAFLFAATLGIAVRYGVAGLRACRWSFPSVWLVFSLVFLIGLPAIPTELNGSYYFAWRLLFLVFLCLTVASSPAMERPGPLPRGLIACAVMVTLLNLWLAVHLISPAARAIATLRDAPLVHASKPGMVMRPTGAWKPEGLSVNPDEWAGANYMREHNLVLYNTSWIYVQIIPIKPRPEALPRLESRYEIMTPIPGGALMQTAVDAKALLGRVGYVVAMRVDTPLGQSPFASSPGSPYPAPWAAGWTCIAKPAWDLCVPPGQNVFQKPE